MKGLSIQEIWMRIRQDLKTYHRGLFLAAAYLGITSVLGIPVCPMILFWGLPCPGCGMTRAALLFFKGKWNTAWQMHPFFFVLLVLAAVAAAFRYGAGRSMPGFKRIVPAVLILSILFYVYRMIRYFPGQEPMTYSSHNILRLLADIHG